MAFKEAKDEYKQQREEQRESLAQFLAKDAGLPNGLRVVSGARAGRGIENYTCGKRIKEYNLSNWKWVEITDDSDFECIVSLNMPNVDPSSRTPLSLFDRIGLLVSYHKNGNYYETKIYTDIDLPLDETEKEKIAGLVLEQYKLYLTEHTEG